MATNAEYLDFETDIRELEEKLARLRATGTDDPTTAEGVRTLRRDLRRTKRRVYADLTPWQTVRVARHPDRPMSRDYIDMLVEDWTELHGDRAFGDDRAIVTGFGRIGSHKVMVVGHQKGRTTREKVACYFGCAHPEGYRKALGKMRLAEKFGLPVVCLVDTPGAYPGIGAEERGQAQVIAGNLMAMSRLRIPIVVVVIGEGCSGGALAIGIGDRVAMLEHAYYSVISPEGCAAILWKSGEHASEAADALRLGAKDLTALGVIDDVIPEPPGGAHRDHPGAAKLLRAYLNRSLRQLRAVSVEDRLRLRYERFRAIGVFTEGGKSR